MNIYTGLLFQQGYIQDPKLALSLACENPPAQEASRGGESAERKTPPERRASFRRGAIFAVCSTALSPFR